MKFVMEGAELFRQGKPAEACFVDYLENQYTGIFVPDQLRLAGWMDEFRYRMSKHL